MTKVVSRQPSQEPRLHAVELPLPVAAETRQALPAPAAIEQNTPLPSPGAALAEPLKKSPLAIPSGVQRVASALRAALPFVQRILPLLDGHIDTGDSNPLTPQHDRPSTSQPLPPIDLAPIEYRLTELKAQYREVRDKTVEQMVSFKRVEDQLGMVSEATDRNTLEQQELIGELKGVGKKINFIAMVALGLLAVTVVTNIVLCLHILKVLH
ncbi:MAG TPA: hypothetical protein VFC37_17715 [Terracidiphilus sp.]|nr:hypothetical protein [Terracidiphilus sp.]